MKIFKNITFVLIILICCFLSFVIFSENSALSIGLFSFFIFLLVLNIFRENKINLLISSFTIAICYLALESFSYFTETIDVSRYVAFNKPMTYYDVISGYKWRNEKARVVQITNDITEFDNYFHPNKQGYMSTKDFTKKKEEDVFRYLVLGDSFSGGYFLNTTWPDKAQQILFEDYKIELYPFAIDGGGIMNWFSIFTKEIIPNYEFDGIIIASYLDDLNRNFFIMHHDEKTNLSHYGYVLNPPQSVEDFNQNFKNELVIEKQIFNDKEIDKKIDEANSSKMEFKSYLISKIKKIIEQKEQKDKVKEYYKMLDNTYLAPVMMDAENYSYDMFLNRYGRKKTNMLDSIANFCNRNNKKLIICGIPDKNGVKINKIGKHTILQADLEFLVSRYDCDYFDGNVPFNNTKIDLNSLYFPIDNHWNQKGSDYFAKVFSEKLRVIHTKHN